MFIIFFLTILVIIFFIILFIILCTLISPISDVPIILQLVPNQRHLCRLDFKSVPDCRITYLTNYHKSFHRTAQTSITFQPDSAEVSISKYARNLPWRWSISLYPFIVSKIDYSNWYI
jgi:hypothetical protein